MADKIYKMTVALSDGSSVNAGTFVAPQGPQGARGATGPQGPAGPQGAGGAINDWVIGQDTNSTVLPDGTYLIRINLEGYPDWFRPVAVVDILLGQSAGVIFGCEFQGEIYIFIARFQGGKLILPTKITIGPNTYLDEEIVIPFLDYIKLK